MHKMASTINNEEGSIIAIVILTMAIVTLVIVSAVQDTSTELQIARNDTLYKINLFQAEGAVREAVQVLNGMADPLTNLLPEASPYSWVHPNPYQVPAPPSPIFYPESSSWVLGAGQNAQLADIPGNTAGYCVVFNGISTGSGIDMTDPTNLYDFTVYGNSTYDDGQCQVMVGYRIRF